MDLYPNLIPEIYVEDSSLKTTRKSPYTATPGRLADVIAAIQAMGVYKFHMRPFGEWAESIGGDSSKASFWRNIFEEHPEFFRLDTTGQLASLVWRRQFPKRFHVDRLQMLSEQEYAALSPQEKERVSRAPLSPSDIKTLIDKAINLQSRAVDIQREGRWWIPLVSSALGGLIGAIVGSLVKR